MNEQLPQSAGELSRTGAGLETDLIFKHGVEHREFAVRGLLAVAAALFFPTAGNIVNAQESEALVLEEIVVTAQRRTENLQDVPIAVTVADAEMLEELRLDNIEDITLLTPSVTFRRTNAPAASAQIQIRGIGTTGQNRTFEGAVGVFVDGVYRSRSGQALSTFLDIDSLQVLRGPQGTLFGKSTSAGALLLESTTPYLGETTGYIQSSYGNFDAIDVRGSLNLGLSDQFAVRLSANHSESEGYLDTPAGDTENDLDVNTFKLNALYQPNDDFSFRLIADYTEQDDECCYGTIDGADGPTTPLIDALSLGLGNPLPSGDDDEYETFVNTATDNQAEDKGVTAIFDWEAWGGSFKSITAIREYDTFQDADGDFSGADVLNVIETFNSEFFSQEFTYTRELRGGTDYLLGIFVSDEDLTMGRDLFHGVQAQAFWDAALGASGVPAGTANAAPGVFADEDLFATAESLGVFTHWNIPLSDRTNLVVGARYSDDKKTGRFEQPFFRDTVFDPLAIAGIAPGILYDESFDDSAVSGTLSFQYLPNDSAMLYVSYNRGYKAGGVNADLNAAGSPGSSLDPTDNGVRFDPVFQTETLDAYELGAKVDWLDGAARTNLSFFYNDIQDLQIAQFLGLIFTVLNSPEAEVYGVEIEHTQALNDVFTLNVFGTFLPEARYGDDPAIGILSGRRFSDTPEFRGAVSLGWDRPLYDGMALTGFVQVEHAGETFTNTASNLKEDSVTLVNANLGLDLENGFSVTAFVRNATDERYVGTHFETPLQTGDQNAYVQPPRTFGIELRKHFD